MSKRVAKGLATNLARGYSYNLLDGFVATTTSTSFSLSVPRETSTYRNIAELALGFGIILMVLWVPPHEQTFLAPLALLVTLSLVLLRRQSLNELGLGLRGLTRSLWILPATVGVMIASVLAAKAIGTFHALYQADFRHVAGYVLWTLYQQFLLQDCFMPRLARLMSSDSAVAVTAVLFAVAHLPNLPLTAATLAWGMVSCLLFRRYRNVYAIGIAQGLLGLTFAVCVPDALHHHLRVGLGFLRYPG
ncbi:MAG TPA: CPBP family intramembrane glutamic endopeptidase [Candidatus Solibacter sp.]|nr:CPBP family intramembrane glutamic endopeptidase [Candidatus Solibacter sp.]